MPTRLIDVSKPGSARLVLSKQLPKAQPYMALSYCWGEGVRHAIELTDKNIGELFTTLPESHLTKSHRDAIQFTRDFGIRYLWIDSLCIIQGNLTDWESESKRMGTVYGNAELTIIAGRAADSREGFLTNDFYLRTKTPPPVTIKSGASPSTRDGADLGPLYVTVPRSGERGPVNTRGWCYQEYLLSINSICFGEEKVFFQCRSGMRCEDGHCTTTAENASQYIYGPGISSKAEVFRRWYSMLHEFTPRALTEPFDVFACVNSIAQQAHRVLQCRYLAGLWEDDMVRGLMWKARHQHYLPLKTPLTRPTTSGRCKGEVKGKPVIRAPSWSWARVQGPVVWDTLARREGRYCDPKTVFIRPLNKNNRWTMQEECGKPDRLYMSALELQFYGRVLRVQCSQSQTASTEMEKYLESLPANLNVSWAPKHRKYGVLLKVFSDSNHLVKRVSKSKDNGRMDTDVVGGGFFDFPNEKRPDNLWCLRVIVDEGLFLTRDGGGKFHRVGWFLMGDTGKKLFEGLEEVAIDLV